VDVDEDGIPDHCDTLVDSDGDGVGDNGDAFPDDANESADSDGDMVGDNADEFPNDANETTDSDGDGVGDNSDAFPNDPERSTDDVGGSQVDETDDGGDSNDSSDDKGWSVVLKESGLDPNLVMGVIGIIIVMVGVFLMVSSRNIKKLKAELEEERVSSDMWDRLDFDKDGHISDIEFEAYKVIRDGGKKKAGTKSGSDDTEDAEDSGTDEEEEMSIEEMAGQVEEEDEGDSSGKGRYDF